MIFLPHDRTSQREAAQLTRNRIVPNSYDLVALAIMVALIVLLAHGATAMRAPAEMLSTKPVTLKILGMPFAWVWQHLMLLRLSSRRSPRAAGGRQMSQLIDRLRHRHRVIPRQQIIPGWRSQRDENRAPVIEAVEGDF
ncbi:hypothetical protein [Mesorhizobium amorphae]|uniref:hypothetical protein n=1 Tax=Mesorhizobium amorphae TaxID=71433 RepID=UPI00178577F0|nr:hypothetical protein [Mesorhizobium amorphae]